VAVADINTRLAVDIAAAPHSQAESGGARFYRPELDILRFCAFLSVFLCHALPGTEPWKLHGRAAAIWSSLQNAREAGNFGVCLFFLLSSYLITELLRLERLRTGTIHIGAFYMRRTLRIWPLYFTFLFLCSLAGLFIPFLHLTAGQILSYIFFVGNWYLLAHAFAQNGLVWLWSISVEEQFYLVWPTMARLGGMRLIAIGSMLCLPLSLAAISYVAHFETHSEVTGWLNSGVQFQFFGLGALLSIALAGRAPRFPRQLRVLMILTAMACWLTASMVCHLKDANVPHGTAAMMIGYELVAAGCVLFFLSAVGATVKQVPQVFVYLGRISYGLYVFHVLVLAATASSREFLEASLPHHWSITLIFFFIERSLGLALTIALASLSYKYLESPFLQLKKRFTFVNSRAV
jgi:peptidoglycan/LPS O-acetylase OafA/YrhL